MDREERLKLLFEQDETLLRTDTRLDQALRMESNISGTAQDLIASTGTASENQVVRAAAVSSPSPPPIGKDKVEEGPDEPPLDNKSVEVDFAELSLNGAHGLSKGGNGEDKTHILRDNKLETGKDSPKRAVHASYGPPRQLFCPTSAVSRFPYKFIKGGLCQEVANRFFDQGKFWERRWDLYYIHVPPRLGSRPLLLVPAAQVKMLIQEINNELECNLTLPTGGNMGFTLSFSDKRTPSPAFLGRSFSREMKEQLETSISVRPANYCDYDPADPAFVKFEKTVRAGIAATKNKKKSGTPSKTKKQLARVQSQREWVRCLKRMQCYFGLRSRRVRNRVYPGVSEKASRGGKVGERQHSLANDTTLQNFNENECAPCSFWNEPVFISVDAELNEWSHSQVTEIGISTLDTLDLVGIPPGKDGENWISRIRARHLRTREYAHIVNKHFNSGCPENFEFGESEWVLLKDLAATVDGCLQPFYPSEVTNASSAKDVQPESSTDHRTPRHKLRGRNVVLVAQNPFADISYLRNLGVTVFDRADFNQGSSLFLDAFDTAESSRILLGELTQRSLGGILWEFGITGWYLHNAGNDARYTMEAMIRIVLRSASSGIKSLLGQGEGDTDGGAVIANQVMEEGDPMDDIDGGKPNGIKKM